MDENLKVRDVTLKYIRENYNIEKEKIMVPVEKYVYEMSLTSGKYSLEGLLEKIRQEFLGATNRSHGSDNIDDYIIEIQYIGHCGEQEYTIFEKIPTLETDAECESRLQKELKARIQEKNKQEKEYEQFLKLKQKFEPE